MKKINAEIKRVGIYIRVSTEEQARHGYSLDSQRENLLEFCNKKCYKVIDIYADEGKSARSKLNSRKELLRLLEDVKNNKIDRIVIWRLDRWIRSVADYYKIQEILETNNVDWECSDEEYDTYTSNGRLYLNMKLSIAQNESDQTADRIKFNFENMVKNKRPITGNQPLGYMVAGEKQNKRVVKDENLSEMINDIFDNIEVTHSVRATLIYINNKYDTTYKYTCFNNLFKNTIYYGEYRNVKDYTEPYVTKERWDNIQTILTRNVKVYKKRQYLFSGMLRCPECGCVMAGTSRKRKYKDTIVEEKFYRCVKHISSKLCPYSKVPSENKIEKWLIENFKNKASNYIANIEEIQLNKKTKKVDKKRLLEKKKRLDELYLDLRISKEKYDKEYLEINKLLEEKEETIDTSIYEECLNNKNLFEIYNSLDIQHRRSFWIKYIDYLIPNNEEFKIFFKK